MAAELLELYAARKAHPGTAFSAPDAYFHKFEADFEFEETPDQAKAIEDVLADLQKPEPMDRLVCGDVGYGKTEVAMRAIFAPCSIARRRCWFRPRCSHTNISTASSVASMAIR